MKTLGIIVTVILIIVLSLYFTQKDSKRIEKLHNEYRTLDIKDELNDTVKGLYTEKGACFITLKSDKIFIKSSSNLFYKEKYLDMVIQIGSLIQKKESSDTIFLTNQNKEYYFRIGMSINKEGI